MPSLRDRAAASSSHPNQPRVIATADRFSCSARCWYVDTAWAGIGTAAPRRASSALAASVCEAASRCSATARLKLDDTDAMPR